MIIQEMITLLLLQQTQTVTRLASQTPAPSQVVTSLFPRK